MADTSWISKLSQEKLFEAACDVEEEIGRAVGYKRMQDFSAQDWIQYKAKQAVAETRPP